MLYFSFVFSLLLCRIIIIHSGFIQDQLFDGTVMHIDRINAECRGKNVSSQGFFQGVKSISTVLFIRNLTLVVKEGGFKKLLLTITIDRCRSKENLDTCEAFFNQPNIDFCKAINPNNFILGNNSFALPLVPPMKCPIAKGIYHAYNFTYDLAPYIFFNPDAWYWKGKGELFSPERNKIEFCTHMAGYITKSKTKKH